MGARAVSVVEGALFKRKIKRLAGGAAIDWNDQEVRAKIYNAITKVNEMGARKLKRKSRSILLQRAYDTGELYKSVKSYPLRQGVMKTFGKHHQAGVAWIIAAGGSKAPYVLSVESGRYFKETGTKVPAVPFMRIAAANTRRWLRPRMIAAIKRALK